MPHEWKDQRIICRAVLQGRETECFATYRVTPMDQAIYRQIADDALTRAIRHRATFKRYFRAKIRNPLTAAAIVAGTVAAVAIGAAVHLSQYLHLDRPGTYGLTGAMAGLSAIAVAALGWGSRDGLRTALPDPS